MDNTFASVLESLEIQMFSSHVRYIPASKNLPTSGEWSNCDEFSVTVSRGGKSLTTSYKTGIGHRKLAEGVKKDPKGFRVVVGSGAAEVMSTEQAVERGWLYVVHPTLADVMACLVSDAEAVRGETFIDWCANMGSDSDSRTALDTYLACQKTYVELRGMLDKDYEKVVEGARDY
jgi:hypothetical protein